MYTDHRKQCQLDLCYFASDSCPIAFPPTSDALALARRALVKTLTSEGKNNAYIADFLDHYDNNLQNIDDWALSKQLLDQFVARFGSGTEVSIELRANENGEPQFHLSPATLRKMLDIE